MRANQTRTKRDHNTNKNNTLDQNTSHNKTHKRTHAHKHYAWRSDWLKQVAVTRRGHAAALKTCAPLAPCHNVLAASEFIIGFCDGAEKSGWYHDAG